MKATQYTLGPWRLIRIDTRPIITGNSSELIAELPNRATHSNVEANARLIAAAPELVEALRVARAILSTFAPGRRVLPLDLASVLPAISVIDAGLSKAGL